MDEPSVALLAQPRPVHFAHCSRRSGDIGWAQQIQWNSINGLAERTSASYDICLSVEVPAGTTVDDFIAAIGRMVSRHESLRTRFHIVDGRLVRQEVVGSGFVEVTQYHVRTGHTPTDELLRNRVGAEVLDIENGHTFRAGFVAAAGEVTHAAFDVSRIVADAGACENVVSSFISELRAVKSGASARPEPVFQQLDQVEWEAGVEGRRAEHQALNYWREKMAMVQALPRPPVLDGGTVRSVIVSAEPVLRAADDIARMFGASSSGVILTAFLRAAAQTLRLDTIGCYLHSSNRSDPARQGSITRLKNLTVLVWSPGSTDPRSAVREVFRNSLEAYRHAQSPGALFLPRLDLASENTPFIHFNDVRSIVPMDGLKGAVHQMGPRAAVDAAKPVMKETAPGYAAGPTLNLGVGAIQGASREPILRVETNLLRTEGISLLLERMNSFLARAVLVPSAGSQA
ncbi:condensation domain-containing protein [Actinosynnema sp. NPDC049800]